MALNFYLEPTHLLNCVLAHLSQTDRQRGLRQALEPKRSVPHLELGMGQKDLKYQMNKQRQHKDDRFKQGNE